MTSQGHAGFPGISPCKDSETCLNNKPMNFLNNRTIFDSIHKILPVYNIASSGLKKMLILTILYTHEGVSENVCPVILYGHHIYLIILMAVFISCYCIGNNMPRQMLLPKILW